jgi:hypothetical protein
MADTTREQAQDASNEPIEVKLIAAASDGRVKVTPEKCEHISRLRSENM